MQNATGPSNSIRSLKGHSDKRQEIGFWLRYSIVLLHKVNDIAVPLDEKDTQFNSGENCVHGTYFKAWLILIFVVWTEDVDLLFY